MVSLREIGSLTARLDIVEAEVEKLRTKTHGHSNALTPALVVVSVVKTLQDRVETLERGRDRLALFVGACAGAGGVIGFCVKWAIDKLG